ncbi:MAG: amidohydrolase family protein [Acidobacteriota bacterium]
MPTALLSDRVFGARYRRLLFAVLILSGTASGLTRQPLAQQSSNVLIRAARWLDPVSGELRGPVVVHVSDGKIAGLVPATESGRPSAAQVVDLGNATLLPGLIDAHVHLEIGGSPAENAKAILRAGFTTVVDLGATSDSVLRLRDRISSGAAEGPRVLAAGLWAGTKGGVCEFGGIGIAGGPDAFRARVRENIAAGADLIKVCVSSWVAPAFTQPEVYEIDDASLAAVVDESRKLGRIVVAHAISLGGAKAALRAGVTGLAHAAYVDAATAADMRARGMFLVPTLASLVGDAAGPAAQALRKSVATAYGAGVPIVFGTDGGVLPHGQNAREFAAMVKAGIPQIDAIRSATVNAARAFKLDNGVGTIAPGSVADLIAVDGDPLGEIESLTRVVFVMHSGQIVRRPGK